MPNRYLDPLPRARVRHPFRWLALLWATLVLLFLVLWDLVQSGPLRSPHLAAIAGAFLVVALGLWRQRRMAGAPQSLAAIEETVLRGDLDRAVAALGGLLAAPLAPLTRAQALGMLGRCAETRGDFREAEEVLDAAMRSLPRPGGLGSMGAAQVVPGLAARRGFALACCDRLDDAERVLEDATGRDAFPVTRALAVRARAVVLARRGDAPALLEVLGRERLILKNGLAWRDALLVRALAAWARRRQDGAFRAPALKVAVDPDTRAWISAVAPAAAAVLEAS